MTFKRFHVRSALGLAAVLGNAAICCTPLKDDVVDASADSGNLPIAADSSAPDADATLPDGPSRDASDSAPDSASDVQTTDGSDAKISAPFSLSIAKPHTSVMRGATTTIGVTLSRDPAFHGTVTTTVSGLPTGVSADALVFAPGVTAGTLTLRADPTASLGDRAPASLDGASGASTASAPFDLLVQDLPGTRDTTFGNNGVATIPIDVETAALGARGIAFQSGKIILCGATWPANDAPGAIALARLSADGVLDKTFGSNGKGTLMLNSPTYRQGSENCAAVHVLPDGRILLAGLGTPNGTHGFLAARLTPDGAVDPTFGAGGTGFFTWNLGSNEAKTFAMAIQADNHILLGGWAAGGSALLRLDPNGLPDTFGTNGNGTVMALTSDNGVVATSAVTGLELFADGRIAVSATGASGFRALRLTTQGAIDTTYGTSGIASTPLGQQTIDRAGQMAIQPDDKVVISGYLPSSGASDAGTPKAIQLARFNADGSLDSTFGKGGIVTTTLPGGDAAAKNVVIAPDGRIVVAIAAPTPAGPVFGVARYTAAGELDKTFGSVGYITTPVGSESDAQTVTVDPESRIVVGGIAWDGSQYSAVMVRYWP